MMKNINVKIIDTSEIYPEGIRDILGEDIAFSKGLKNNFEVINSIYVNDELGVVFLCSYKGKFFIIPIEHVKKI